MPNFRYAVRLMDGQSFFVFADDWELSDGMLYFLLEEKTTVEMRGTVSRGIWPWTRSEPVTERHTKVVKDYIEAVKFSEVLRVSITDAQRIEAGTAETAQPVPCEAREPDPEGDAP